MSGICGWFGPGTALDAAGVLERMGNQASIAPVKRVEQIHTARAGLASVGNPQGAFALRHDEVALVISGHPRWRPDGRPGRDIAAVAAALLAALRDKGRAALTDLGGDFACAFVDERSGTCLLAVDRIGVRSLAYAKVGTRLVFGSTLDALGAFPETSRRLSTQALFDYLYFHAVPGPHTIFEQQFRVPAGHCVEMRANGEPVVAPYWQMRFDAARPGRLEPLKGEFVGHLEAATNTARDGAACGAFLSGGTDSSTITGMLARTSGQPAHTFSIGFAAEGYDEMDYARLAARHFSCAHHEYYVTPDDVTKAAPQIAAAYDQPFGNASALPTLHCARMGRDLGLTRMLAGDGGDELFGGNARYAKQQIFGWYHALPQWTRTGLLEPMLLGSDIAAKLPLVRKARRYVEQARPSMPGRYESYNLLDHIGLGTVFAADFVASVDIARPHALMREAHAPYSNTSLINQMLGIDLRFTLADSDLPKVTRMCELAGIDVAFPMLDDDLVTFSGQLPSSYKLRGTQLRWFFKEALRDFLPPAVITKKKHGFGLPVGVWLTTHRPLFDLARDALATLRTRGIFEPRFTAELTDRLLPQHPGYYGVMVWVMMILAIWLESRGL